MKLKSMKLVGFKSFANKTTINFEPGLTTIVGPNGSGKSNVIEAIRWVLGEQSAKNLRGTKMADVIFSGSDTQKALNRAEVSLTFDNSDHYLNSPYSEITISRKIFRDGQGGYSLNGQECRLKDINNLLVDSGIGKGSFSIISQGNVEKIFNSKPEERRTIIETTAGIYKYKLQKQQAEGKLSDTNDNLTRVNDIIYELSDRVNHLKTESQNAQKYLDLKKKLSRLNDVKMTYQLAQLEQRLAANNKTDQYLSNGVKVNQKEIASFGKQRDALQVQLQKLIASNDHLQAQLLDVSGQVERKISQKQLADQKYDFRQEQLQKIATEQKNLSLEIKHFNEEIKNVELKYRNATDDLQQLNQQAVNLGDDDLNQQLSTVNQELYHLRNQHLQLVQKLNKLDNSIKSKKQDRQHAKVHFTELQSDLKQLHSKLTKNKDRIDELNEERKTLNSTYNDVQGNLTQNNNELTNLNNQFEQHQNQWYEEIKDYQQLKSRLTGLQRILGEHAGFYQGSQNLLKAKLTGIVGAVADFIQVDDKYTLAIETALGSRLQQVIVVDKNAAKSSIDYLKQNRLGRATLLPLDNLVEHRIKNDLLVGIRNVKGFIGTADQLVKMKPSLSTVKNYLLGNILIVTDLKTAFQVSDQIAHRFKVVTLAGEIINAGGAVTGGIRKGDQKGLLAQQNVLSNGLIKCQKLKLKCQSSEDQLSKLKRQITEQKRLIEKLTKELLPRQQKVARIDGELTNLTSILQKQQEQVNEVERQIKIEAPKQFQSVEDQSRVKLNDQINANQLKIDQLNQQVQDLNAQRSSTNRTAQTLNQKLRDQQQQVTDLKIKVSNLKSQKMERQRRFDNLTSEKLELNESSSINQKEVDLDHLTKEIDEGQTKIKTWQLQVKHNKVTLSQFQDKQRPLEAKITKAQDKLISDRSRLEQTRVMGRRLASQVEQLKKTLLEQPTPLEVDPTKINIDKVERQISKLNEETLEIGTVNINSIDEYNSVNERYTFLVDQADDLKTAKKQLTQTMNKMDKTVKDRFQKTFDDLKVAFRKTFQQIFGGGDAKLILDDPGHLLTTGVEIMAQPPGKKYRNMSLLSGGERALTAIALLFAIINLQPVPFCILDEAESALDSANVDRFARYISQLKGKTQFIVITHRKETMVYADQLYGVTMQHSGVSQVIDVNLKQIQKTED